MNLQALAFLIVAAAADLVGAWFFLMKSRWEDAALRLLLGTGAGFMLSVAFVEMIPEATSRSAATPVWILAGFLLVHLFEHVLTPHFHYGQETHGGLGTNVGVAATLGLSLHSFIDGVAIVVAWQAGARLAFIVFLAMAWHKIPDGFTAASVVRATGGSRAGAFRAAAFLGAASVLGGLIYAVLPSERWIGPALALSAGSLTYVAATDLLPEVNKRRTVIAPLGVIAGVGIFYLVHLVLEG